MEIFCWKTDQQNLTCKFHKFRVDKLGKKYPGAISHANEIEYAELEVAAIVM